MSIQMQLRRGNNTDNTNFVGAEGEVTINTDTHELRVHDAITIGGHQIPTMDQVQAEIANIPSIYYTPNVDANGIISWTNNGSLNNPEQRNIKGPKGEDGTNAIAFNVQPGTYSSSVPLPDFDTVAVNNAYIFINANSTYSLYAKCDGATTWTVIDNFGGTGPQGETGYVFTPSVDEDGDLSWTNNGNLPNPETVNIKGPQGETGQTGATGPQGPQGVQGVRGMQGLPGDTGHTTNCITEIPQDIKLDLNEGEIILKSGSKIHIPNGNDYIPDVTEWDTENNTIFNNYNWTAITKIPQYVGENTYKNLFWMIGDNGNSRIIETNSSGNLTVVNGYFPINGANIGHHDWTSLACTCYDNLSNNNVINGNTFVAISSDGYVAVKPAGSTNALLEPTAPNANLGNHNWKCVTYGNSKFVTISEGGYISTSTDGINWDVATENSNLGNHNWSKVIYDGINFVALGGQANNIWISTSSDGLTWTVASENYDGSGGYNWKGFVFDGTNYVAINWYAQLSTSTDCTTWTTPAKITGVSQVADIVWDEVNGEFIILKTPGDFSKSSDGVTWVDDYIKWYIYNNKEQNNFKLIYDGEKFVGLHENGELAVSTNVPMFSYPTQNSNLNGYKWDAFGSNGTIYVMIGRQGGSAINTYITTSVDGVTWDTPVSATGLNGISWHDIVYDGTKFTAFSNGGYVSVSTDGIIWSEKTRCTSILGMTMFAYGNGTYVAVNSSGNVATSSDCENWTSGSVGYISMTDIVFDGSQFIIIGSSGAIFTSSDGLTWTQSSVNEMQSRSGWKKIYFDGTRFIAISNYGYASVANNVSSWSFVARENNLNSRNWNGLFYNGSIYIVIDEDGYVSTSTSEIAWAPLYKISWPSPKNNDIFVDFAFDGTNYVAFGGTFDPLLGYIQGYNKVSYSTNLKTWSGGATTNLLNGTNIIYNGEQFVSLSSTGDIYTSTDATTWTTTYAQIPIRYPDYPVEECKIKHGVIYAANMYVVISTYGHVSTSANISGWTNPQQNTYLGNHGWCSIIYDGTKFVALGEDGYISTSSNGRIWSTPTPNTDLGDNKWSGAVFDGRKFLALSYYNKTAYTNTNTVIPDFSDITTTQNVSYQFTNESGKYVLFDGGNYFALQNCVSGDTDSLENQPNHVWYDTSNNLVKVYDNNGEEIVSTFGFPVGVATLSSGSLVSIDQIFNGFGYIGSTIYMIQNVKWLVPNGRSSESNVNNIESLTLSCKTYTNTTPTNGLFYITTDGSELYERSTSNVYEYNIKLNYNVYNNSITNEVAMIKIQRETVNNTDGCITQFQPKQVLFIEDSNNF